MVVNRLALALVGTLIGHATGNAVKCLVSDIYGEDRSKPHVPGTCRKITLNTAFDAGEEATQQFTREDLHSHTQRVCQQSAKPFFYNSVLPAPIIQALGVKGACDSLMLDAIVLSGNPAHCRAPHASKINVDLTRAHNTSLAGPLPATFR